MASPRTFFAVICLAIIAAAPLKATTCRELADAQRVDLDYTPGALQFGWNNIAESARVLDCTAAESAMFVANHHAIKDAAPPKDQSELYGTWLGDFTLHYLAGLVVAGQEVLRIEPIAVGDRLRVTQYWFKASVPRDFPWNEAAGYHGIVAVADLPGRKGKWSYDPFGDSASDVHSRSTTSGTKDPRTFWSNTC